MKASFWRSLSELTWLLLLTWLLFTASKSSDRKGDAYNEHNRLYPQGKTVLWISVNNTAVTTDE